MKNKVLLVILMLFVAFTLTACNQENETINEDAIKFKEEYESLNGEVINDELTYRTVSISEENPFVYTTADDIIKKMDNQETMYVYFGSKYCPWCRSVIEKAIEVAKENDIDKIYYIDIWDDERNEILRDKYILNDKNKLEQTVKGTDAYYELLKRFDDLLTDYTLKDKKGKTIEVGEKRIYAPSFVYINKGSAETLITGMSDKQETAFADLTNEILEDEEQTFTGFFK